LRDNFIAGFSPACRIRTLRLWNRVPLQPLEMLCVITRVFQMEEIRMRKTLAVLATVAAVAATSMIAPVPAEARGIGPGLAFGLAAGAVAAGAAGAYYYGPYGYGPRYYGYGPAYYGPGYGPYAYYGGGPYYGHRHWRRW
jgi:hypothetical protein